MQRISSTSLHRFIGCIATLALAGGCTNLGSGRAFIGHNPSVQHQQTSINPGVSTSKSGDPGRIGTVNGSDIHESDFDLETKLALMDIENVAMQRQLHLRWLGFERTVEKRLLRDEAKRRNLSVAELISEEVEGKVIAPSLEQVRAVYHEYQDQLGLPFEMVQENIRSELIDQTREDLRAQLIDRLKASSAVSVQYDLPIPHFPRYPIHPGRAPFTGPESAVITVVEFADFHCPHSREAFKLIDALRKRYSDKLRVVFRHLPLPQHPTSKRAAQASHCAHRQGFFWPYHQMLFEHRGIIDAKHLRNYAKTLQLNLDQFEQCMQAETTEQQIKRDQRAAKQFGVEATPSIFINGIKLTGVLPLEVVTAIIDEEYAQLDINP